MACQRRCRRCCGLHLSFHSILFSNCQLMLVLSQLVPITAAPKTWKFSSERIGGGDRVRRIWTIDGNRSWPMFRLVLRVHSRIMYSQLVRASSASEWVGLRSHQRTTVGCQLRLFHEDTANCVYPIGMSSPITTEGCRRQSNYCRVHAIENNNEVNFGRRNSFYSCQRTWIVTVESLVMK